MKIQIPVPAAAFAMGEGGEIAPDAGELIDFTGRGTVTMRDGQAMLTPTEINGQPVAGDDEPSLDDEEAELRAGLGDDTYIP